MCPVNPVTFVTGFFLTIFLKFALLNIVALQSRQREGTMLTQPKPVLNRLDECIKTLQDILSGAKDEEIHHETQADLKYLLGILEMNRRTFREILNRSPNEPSVLKGWIKEVEERRGKPKPKATS